MAKTKACVDVTDAEIARGVGKPQIGKHVAAAAGNFDLLAHEFFAFFVSAARARACFDRCSMRSGSACGVAIPDLLFF